MPALLAYLIALCLLIGGGYGALNWLAAPEPTQVAAKANPKSKSFVPQVRPEGIAENSLLATPTATASAVKPNPFPVIEKAEVPSIDTPALYEAETDVAAVDRDVQPNVTPSEQQRGLAGETAIRAGSRRPAPRRPPLPQIAGMPVTARQNASLRL